MRRLAVLFLLPILSALITGCASSGDAPISQSAGTASASQTISTSADVRDALLESSSSSVLRRWNRDVVRVRWHGPSSAADRAMLEAVMRWISAEEGAPQMVLATEGDAEIDLHRAAQSEWTTILGEAPKRERDNADGITLATWSADGVMRHATVVIDDASPQHQRNRTIAHELLHALGFGHHSCAGGLVYGGGDYNPAWEPTEFDRALVRLLYDVRLQSGVTAGDLSGLITIDGSGPSCPPVRWQSVRVDQTSAPLWCRVMAGVQECSAVDEQRGPVDGLPVVGWLKDGTLYDHDPERFVTFDLDGQRVLCALPTQTVRGACQRTTGNLVEVPEMWTDGDVLYPEP